MLNYRKDHFDPATAGARPVLQDGREDWAFDSDPGQADLTLRHYIFPEEAVLALNIALATGRPLLVSGEPGTGKTSLGRFAAQVLARPFYRYTVTSRMQAADLLSSYDALRRLADAQARKLKPDQAYVTPRALWWALAPASAARRGLREEPGVAPAKDPAVGPANAQAAALLIDEIDKADPDVPNDLLEVLDESRFTVYETGQEIEPERASVLIVLTTNGERELPPAFLRRCVTLELPRPTRGWLLEIARQRFGAEAAAAPLHEHLADAVMKLREAALADGRRPPGTSEFVDAVVACRELLQHEWNAREAELERILHIVLAKGGAPAQAAA